MRALSLPVLNHAGRLAFFDPAGSDAECRLAI